MQCVQGEDAVRDKVGQILCQQFGVVEHAEEVMEAIANHDEIEGALELKADKCSLKAIDFWQDQSFQTAL